MKTLGFFNQFFSFRNTVADKIHVSAQNQVNCRYIYLCMYVSEMHFKSMFTSFIIIYKDNFCVQRKLYVIQF